MKNISLFVLLSLTYVSFSQKNDSTNVPGHFGGAVTVTNNGISFIPNFSLGKPAAIFDLSIGRRLSFEPQFRFALEGKPWSFIFWWRYKLLKTEKFQINIGAHPAIVFRTKSFLVDNISKETIVAERYLAGELSPNYSFSKNINIGMYYLYGYCIEKDATKNTNFLALRCNFSNIKLSKQILIRFNPQIYYLKMDDKDGFYYSSALTLARRNFPVSISALINQPFHTNIAAGKDFIWNASLIYSFNKEYVEK